MMRLWVSVMFTLMVNLLIEIFNVEFGGQFKVEFGGQFYLPVMPSV